MSIDQRLRSGLGSDDAGPPDTAVLLDGWTDLEARAERRRARDRARWVSGLVVVAVLVVLAATTWWPRDRTDVRPIEPVPSPSATAGPSAPLEGTWSTGPVPAQGIVEHLRSAGLDQWAEGVLQETPASATIEYRLKLQGGRVNLTLSVDGAAANDQDLQSYEVIGSSVIFTPIGSTCSATFRWGVEGDRLRLALVSDDCPDYRGTPDAALMHGLYGAFPFIRAGA